MPRSIDITSHHQVGWDLPFWDEPYTKDDGKVSKKVNKDVFFIGANCAKLSEVGKYEEVKLKKGDAAYLFFYTSWSQTSLENLRKISEKADKNPNVKFFSFSLDSIKKENEEAWGTEKWEEARKELTKEIHEKTKDIAKVEHYHVRHTSCNMTFDFGVNEVPVGFLID